MTSKIELLKTEIASLSGLQIGEVFKLINAWVPKLKYQENTSGIYIPLNQLSSDIIDKALALIYYTKSVNIDSESTLFTASHFCYPMDLNEDTASFSSSSKEHEHDRENDQNQEITSSTNQNELLEEQVRVPMSRDQFSFQNFIDKITATTRRVFPHSDQKVNYPLLKNTRKVSVNDPNLDKILKRCRDISRAANGTATSVSGSSSTTLTPDSWYNSRRYHPYSLNPSSSSSVVFDINKYTANTDSHILLSQNDSHEADLSRNNAEALTSDTEELDRRVNSIPVIEAKPNVSDNENDEEDSQRELDDDDDEYCLEDDEENEEDDKSNSIKEQKKYAKIIKKIQGINSHSEIQMSATKAKSSSAIKKQ